MKIARVEKSGKETFGLVKNGKIATKDDITHSTGVPIPLNVRDFLFDGWYEEIIPKIMASPFQVEVAGHTDSDKMPKKWRKRYASNWELSAARGASVVRYMIDKGIPAPRLLAAGYGAWAPHGLDSIKKANPTWNPLSLTWEEEVKTSTGIVLPTVVTLNASSKLKAKNRRIQITFLNPPHHGDSYKD